MYAFRKGYPPHTHVGPLACVCTSVIINFLISEIEELIIYTFIAPPTEGSSALRAMNSCR